MAESTLDELSDNVFFDHSRSEREDRNQDEIRVSFHMPISGRSSLVKLKSTSSVAHLFQVATQLTEIASSHELRLFSRCGAKRAELTDKNETLTTLHFEDSVAIDIIVQNISLVLTKSCRHIGHYGMSSYTLELWNARTQKCLFEFTGCRPEDATSATFSNDGTRVVIAFGDGTARIWSTTSGEMIYNFEASCDSVHGMRPCVLSASFSQNGAMIVTVLDNDTVQIWDITSKDCIQIVENRDKGANFVTNAVFSPDSLFVLTASGDNKIRVWNIHSGICTQTFGGHDLNGISGIGPLSFSPDGTQAASGADDGSVKLWNVETGHCICDLQTPLQDTYEKREAGMFNRKMLVARSKTTLRHEVTSIAFSPNGQQVATTGGGTVRIQNIQTGLLITPSEAPLSSSRALYLSDNHLIVEVKHPVDLSDKRPCSNNLLIWDLESDEYITAFSPKAEINANQRCCILAWYGFKQ